MATILLAEDERDLRRVLLRTLRRAGLTVVDARSGAEAVVLGRFERLDLVITDLGLKDMNGVALAERLRARSPGLPTLLISGSDESTVALPPSPSAFLPKPFSPDELLSAVASLLQEGGREQARRRANGEEETRGSGWQRWES